MIVLVGRRHRRALLASVHAARHAAPLQPPHELVYASATNTQPSCCGRVRPPAAFSCNARRVVCRWRASHYSFCRTCPRACARSPPVAPAVALYTGTSGQRLCRRGRTRTCLTLPTSSARPGRRRRRTLQRRRPWHPLRPLSFQPYVSVLPAGSSVCLSVSVGVPSRLSGSLWCPGWRQLSPVRTPRLTSGGESMWVRLDPTGSFLACPVAVLLRLLASGGCAWSEARRRKPSPRRSCLRRLAGCRWRSTSATPASLTRKHSGAAHGQRPSAVAAVTGGGVAAAIAAGLERGGLWRLRQGG